MSEKLYLIDGNSFCYRAYYAIRDLTTSKGFPTNAIYGFVNMLKKIMQDESPDYLAVCFDRGEPTFRHKRYKEYKIQRKPMPDELFQQLPVIKQVLKGFGIAIFEKEGFEADDIIGTLAQTAADKDIKVYIATSDKDAIQLVDENIYIYNTHKEGLIYDKHNVAQRYNVEPSKFIDVVALMGDTSDNIPGVPGIGEKTAVKLINEFGSLENLIDNADKIKSESMKELVNKYKQQAFLSKELATIDTSVEVDTDITSLKVKEPDKKALSKIFKELEFRNLMKEFTPDAELKAEYNMVNTEKQLDELIKNLLKQKEVAFDFETTSVNPMDAELVGASFCWQKDRASYIHFKKDEPSNKDAVLTKLTPFFENDKIKKIGQNIKYEKVLLANNGIGLKGIAFDTMVASYLLNPSKANHRLSDISLEYLEYKMIPITDLIGKGKKATTMDMLDPERVCVYCCQDSIVTLMLKELLLEELKQKDLYRLFCDVEIPLIDVLSDMEYTGVNIDERRLAEISPDMENRLERLTSQIYEIAGCEFNINSPKQLAEVLFQKLKLPVIKKTKTGFSTDVDVLKRLSAQHALPALLLQYRELAKLKSTYVDRLPELVNRKTNRVHTSYNQAVTATGRLSSSDPNLQNIPIKTEEGKRIREAFTSGEAKRELVSADYSQIELRILAHLSEDKELIQAFKGGLDVHRHTASLIFGLPAQKVADAQRAVAKTVNFGIIYGMSPYGLSKELNIVPDEAKAFIDAYFEKYKKVSKYIEKQIEFARKNGYVLTMLGRRRYIPEINSENQAIRQFAERTAINTPIQGTAADLIKIAMIKIYERFKEKALKSKMVLQVHDELVFDILKKEKDELVDIVRECMEGAVKLKIPVEVSIKSGKNWSEC